MCIYMSKEGIKKLEKSLKIARENGDKKSEGIILGKLGDAYLDSIDYDRSIGIEDGRIITSTNIYSGSPRKAINRYLKAQEIFRELGDRESEVKYLIMIGVAYNISGNDKKVIKYNKEALKIFREIEFKSGMVICLGNISEAYLFLGNWKNAAKYGEEGLKILRETENKAEIANFLSLLGYVYSNFDDIDQWNKSVNYYKEALEIFVELGDKQNEGAGLLNLGGIYSDLGDWKRAERYYWEALMIFRDLGDKGGEGRVLQNLAGISSNLGNWKLAERYYWGALEVFRGLDDLQAEVRILYNLGRTSKEIGATEAALKYFEDALRILNETYEHLFEYYSQTMIIKIAAEMIDLERYEEAEKLYSKTLENIEFVSFPVQAAIFHNLAFLMLKKKKYNKARNYVKKSLSISEIIGDKKKEAESLILLAQINQSVRKPNEAVNALDRAARIQTEIRDEVGLMYNYQTLSSVLSEIGETKKAHEFLRAAKSISDRLRLPQSDEIAADIEKLDKVYGRSNV